MEPLHHTPWTALEKVLSSPPTTTVKEISTRPSHVAGNGHPLPRFYFKKPAERGSIVGLELQRTLLEVIQSTHEQAVFSSDELDVLWKCLCSHSTAQSDGESQRASFLQYLATKEDLGSKYEQYFKPSLFFRFSRDDQGRIDILQFFNFVLRKVSLMQTRVDLSKYDGDADGYLVENELQLYIKELMPSLNLRNMSGSFEKFYVCTAVRKLLFFLNPLRKERTSIESILLSPILTELFELRDPELPREYAQSNWFSSYSALRVYGQFISLDSDRNGMLSRKELSKYRQQSLTSVFLDRVFQEYQTYNNEMDFNAFLDFVLAMENMHTPQSITYFFKLIDVYGFGYLDETIMTFFFQNELFDMAHPKDLTRLTLQDLIDCGVGGTILNILSDYNGLHTYESRDGDK
ncbi:hypothetical protein BSLG_007586 [Batrachochytrium salamandrivorans]|nr:hypothetical protein BSLG_007586 [Batrachochytrium salamandrivorans]